MSEHDIQPSLDPAAATLPQASGVLSILTYNVHSCIGTDRRMDPERIAEVIAAARPDVIALQELDVGRARTGGIDQAARIADLLRMTSHFHPALHVREEQYGDAILTALPSRLIKAGPIPSVGETRGALWVEVMVDGRPVQIFNTHFGLRRGERRQQAETLLGDAWIGNDACRDQSIILTGDFNAIPSSVAYGLLKRRLLPVRVGVGAGSATGMRMAPTFPSRFPLLRLDHIFVSEGIETITTGPVRTPLSRIASDHLPLQASLRIGGS
ncbi:endonuclease/exonuclease/phosphatase family protein [Rhizobiaceae bacterium CRRU44]|uniref:Endonuclease/exonuclease/phosphatase family protein n=1 Tax=Ferranicluibacter rubi TaxID=2715133 RepID=A0AA44CEB0_9HYPH|nr:endonuclease/exonuclease/phosphatase family protein [Ferranicluibacter rubi]NHT77957.1 endonuclease/exonuclease/phosphatase family protein [Ferranicluibacter rubi]